ncbi:hypothetical protein B5M09_012833 [Aphanomyces astaci]|uniref:FYVE zinc finger domain-containing protein n=1 Tax=Aphanomyces astaci TaxID=112090 RepID=A0A3R7ZIS5_APHAT|nr:hypothetical protein B5M09_012833 [Aphanomyces astaci]
MGYFERIKKLAWLIGVGQSRGVAVGVAMVVRLTHLIQEADSVLMDRLSHRLHWKDPSVTFECHHCKTFFHWNPKSNCAMCGNVVCVDCSEAAKVEGTMVSLRTGDVRYVTVVVDVCVPCYYTSLMTLSTASVANACDDDIKAKLRPERPTFRHLGQSLPLHSIHEHRPPQTPVSRKPPPTSQSMPPRPPKRSFWKR